MIPLWTRAMRPVQSTWGWALVTEGRPWVAHRVCPMPVTPSVGAVAACLVSSSSDRVPWALRPRHSLSSLPVVIRAIPAES